MGKSQSAVANKLRLLKLPEDTLRALRDGGCTERHARALLRLEDPSQRQKALEQILSRQLTVAQTDALVDQLLSPPPRTRTKRTFVVKDVRLFLNTLTRSLDLMRSAGVDARCPPGYGRRDPAHHSYSPASEKCSLETSLSYLPFASGRLPKL